MKTMQAFERSGYAVVPIKSHGQEPATVVSTEPLCEPSGWPDSVGWTKVRAAADEFGRTDNLFARASAAVGGAIICQPKVLRGVPCVEGTRVPVYVILEGLAEGRTLQQLKRSFPRIRMEQLRAAIRFAANVTER